MLRSSRVARICYVILRLVRQPPSPHHTRSQLTLPHFIPRPTPAWKCWRFPTGLYRSRATSHRPAICAVYPTRPSSPATRPLQGAASRSAFNLSAPCPYPYSYPRTHSPDAQARALTRSQPPQGTHTHMHTRVCAAELSIASLSCDVWHSGARGRCGGPRQLACGRAQAADGGARGGRRRLHRERPPGQTARWKVTSCWRRTALVSSGGLSRLPAALRTRDEPLSHPGPNGRSRRGREAQEKSPIPRRSPLRSTRCSSGSRGLASLRRCGVSLSRPSAPSLHAELQRL